MKLKLQLVLTDPAKYLKGYYHHVFTLLEGETSVDGWINCGEVEIDVDVDTGMVLEVAKAELDNEIGKHTAAINVLENRKSELLALTYDGDS